MWLALYPRYSKSLSKLLIIKILPCFLRAVTFQPLGMTSVVKLSRLKSLCACGWLGLSKRSFVGGNLAIIFFNLFFFLRFSVSQLKIIKLALHKKMKFSVKDFFRKCEQIHRKMEICSHLLKKNLKLDSHLPKKFVSFALLKAFKNDKKCFLFYLKSSFRSQNI